MGESHGVFHLRVPGDEVQVPFRMLQSGSGLPSTVLFCLPRSSTLSELRRRFWGQRATNWILIVVIVSNSTVEVCALFFF